MHLRRRQETSAITVHNLVQFWKFGLLVQGLKKGFSCFAEELPTTEKRLIFFYVVKLPTSKFLILRFKCSSKCSKCSQVLITNI